MHLFLTSFSLQSKVIKNVFIYKIGEVWKDIIKNNRKTVRVHMRQDEHGVFKSNIEISKSWEWKAQHKEASQWHCDSVLWWQMVATLEVSIA